MNLKNTFRKEKFSIRKFKGIGAASAVIGMLAFTSGVVQAGDEGNLGKDVNTKDVGVVDLVTDKLKVVEEKPDNLVESNVVSGLNSKQSVANETNVTSDDTNVVGLGETHEVEKNNKRSKRALSELVGEVSDNKDTALLERKGSAVKDNQAGVIVPNKNELGGDDPNAHVRYDELGEGSTVDDLLKVLKDMPDDFQNNERSYLRNMDTLGDKLNLQPGEIRELEEFGGWKAIDKDGIEGKFAIGRKNEQGYFTGWHKVGETKEGVPIIEQGGMLGADALDNVFVHEQALDRRFKYMLMLTKGRTRANRTDTVVDGSEYDPRASSARAGLYSVDFSKLPFLEREKFNKYSPGVVGYNGIEKTFSAFATDFGSRVKIDFVTGFISDLNGNKGGYRVIVKARNKDSVETKVYDETIYNVAEIIQNNELINKGLNYRYLNTYISKFFKDELHHRAGEIFKEKIKNSVLKDKKKADYTLEDKQLVLELREQALAEAKAQGDITLPIDKDFLSIANASKTDSAWSNSFNSSDVSLVNTLNFEMRKTLTNDAGDPDTPMWFDSKDPKSKADDRLYKLFQTLIPGVKSIVYHVKDGQLEVVTDKYSYKAASNGNKEIGIQGSDIEGTAGAKVYNLTDASYEIVRTNTGLNAHYNGWARTTKLDSQTNDYVRNEDFGYFGHMIGVDKGIVRTNVLSDEELTKRIIKALDGDESKLGRAGYFSTSDILLDKDVVSYTVQVFSADNTSVGVNNQSSRRQYNLPILADFSVIQDTIAPSKDVAIRIVTKLKEQGKITDEQEKELKDGINKSKKTSELRTFLLRGDVRVKYQDLDGNVLEPVGVDLNLGNLGDEGAYLVAKDQFLGNNYDVTGKRLNVFTASNGKQYRLKKVTDDTLDNGRLKTSDVEKGTIINKGVLVTYVYEEYVPPVIGKGLVRFEHKGGALAGYPEITLEGEVGKEFSSTLVDEKIAELKRKGYVIVEDGFTSGNKVVDSVKDVDGKEPSQVYVIKVVEKEVPKENEVPNTEKPKDVIDGGSSTIEKPKDIIDGGSSTIEKPKDVLEIGAPSKTSNTSVNVHPVGTVGKGALERKVLANTGTTTTEIYTLGLSMLGLGILLVKKRRKVDE